MANNQLDIFVHYNFNKNEIRNVSLENRGATGSVPFGFTYSGIPQGATGSEKGVMYFDTNINRLMVWDGNYWRIAKYLDDRDFSYTENLLIDNVWIESSLIPTDLSSASDSNIVEYVSVTFSWNPDSYEFILENEKVVPSIYGSFYEMKLFDYIGNPLLPDGPPGWQFIGNTLLFPQGFPDNVYSSKPPIANFWRYTGRLGSYNFFSGYSKIIEITGVSTDNLLEKTYIPISNIRENNIISVTVNGVVIYRYNYDENTGKLVIDNSISTGLGYEIEPDDILRIETNLDIPISGTYSNPRIISQ
jgi:hypothetical protein